MAGAGAGDLEGGRGGDGEDGGLRVRRDARQVAARGHRLRDQPLHAHPGEVITEPVLLSLLGLQSSCLCLLITNIERQKKCDLGCEGCLIVFAAKGVTGLRKMILMA